MGKRKNYVSRQDALDMVASLQQQVADLQAEIEQLKNPPQTEQSKQPEIAIVFDGTTPTGIQIGDVVALAENGAVMRTTSKQVVFGGIAFPKETKRFVTTERGAKTFALTAQRHGFKVAVSE